MRPGSAGLGSMGHACLLNLASLSLDLALSGQISVLLFLPLARLSRGAQRTQGRCLSSMISGDKLSKVTQNPHSAQRAA